MKDPTPVAVTSRSFSRHPTLRRELLERYSNVAFNDAGLSLASQGLVAFLKGRVKAITALEVIDEAVLAQLPELKLLSKFGVGLDMIDQEALKRRGVKLAHAPGVNRRSVSELVVALAIALLRRVVPASREVPGGIWKQVPGRCLSGKTVGIVGCGQIGRDLVLLLKPFGCRVLAYDLFHDAAFNAEHGVTPLPLEELLAQSDVVTLHLSLNESTRGLLNAERLARMKKDAVLVNVSRGGLVDETAVKTLLKENRLAGAAFDVFAEEPPRDGELLALPTFIATPHIGGSTEEAILAMGRAAIAGLEADKAGRS